jgi:DNA modification methylase
MPPKRRTSQTRRKTRRRLINQYLVCDSRRLPAILPNRPFIDVTITSPPYWNIRDYDRQRQIGFGQSYEAYLNDLTAVFGAIHSRTKPTGSLWVITDTLKLDGELRLLPFDLAYRLKGVGWKLQDIIIWNKDKTLPWSHQGKLRNIFEYVAFFSKSDQFNYFLDDIRDIDQLREWWVRYPERYSPNGKAPTRAWNIPIPRQGSWGNNWVRHFCPLPPDLVKRVLLLTTQKGDVVFDPFAGSGAVLAQAKAMGRRYIGTDLNGDYKKMFERKVLPAIARIHRRAEDTNGDGDHKRKFSRSIRALRRTKFPKELVRLYEKHHGKLAAKAVMALKESRNEVLDLVFLFSPSARVSRDFLRRMEELCGRAPLSKYGLTPVVSACTLDGLTTRLLKKKGLKDESRLYLYAHGRTYSCLDYSTVRTLVSNISRNGNGSAKNGYPPIFSNVRVKIDPKKPFS